jgi:DNA-binding transcriptional MocR family regulator
MPAERRAELLRVIEKLGLVVIEDGVYGFLDDEMPLAALAPDSCIVLDSLSKKVAPGLALGGVAKHNLAEAKAAGASGVAAMGELMRAKSPGAAAADLMAAWNSAPGPA